MAEQTFYDYFRRDLSTVLPLTQEEANQIVAKLDYETVYMLSAALSFLKSIKDLDKNDKHNRVRILCTFFVIEAFVNTLRTDNQDEPYEKFAWFLNEYLTDDEIIALLCGFAFSEIQPTNSEERKPLHHVMRASVVKDRDYLRKHVFGILKPSKYPRGTERDARIAEEERLLAEYVGPTTMTNPFTEEEFQHFKECTAPCDCEHWLRLHISSEQRVRKYLKRLAQNLYCLRDSLAHHGFPAHFGVTAQVGTMVDRCVWRSKNNVLTSLSFAVTIQFTELANILERCMARSLIAHHSSAGQ